LGAILLFLSPIRVVVDENVIIVVTKSTSEAIVGNKVVVAVVDYHGNSSNISIRPHRFTRWGKITITKVAKRRETEKREAGQLCAGRN
jgi:uncharacterized protein (DUF1786 family)